MDKYEYINNLLNQNNLSLIDLAEYYSNNKTLIDSFRDVFEEKYEDDKYVLSTIPLVIRAEKSDLINYDKADLEQYKLPILTAMLYNNKFFVHACNWCSYVLYKAEQAESEDTTDILKPNWGSLLQNHISIPLGEAASSPGWVDIYPPENEKSNLWISYKKKDNTMHFIYRFDEPFEVNHACIQIKLKGLFDLEGNEIPVVEIDSDLNEFHEISKKIKTNFDSSFEIIEILIKQ